jgi:hypothetical protein
MAMFVNGHSKTREWLIYYYQGVKKQLENKICSIECSQMAEDTTF